MKFVSPELSFHLQPREQWVWPQKCILVVACFFPKKKKNVCAFFSIQEVQVSKITADVFHSTGDPISVDIRVPSSALLLCATAARHGD